MSELGNKIRLIRGPLSQAEFAEKTNLSLRTISKLEGGQSVRLDTIRRIAATFKLSEPERLELIVNWIKLEIGEDFHKVDIGARNPAAHLKDSENLLGKIQVRLRDVPRKYQEEICIAIQRPEILRCLEHLNDLYESIRKSGGPSHS